MRDLLPLFMLFAAILAVTFVDQSVARISPDFPSLPPFKPKPFPGGTGPFNPNPKRIPEINIARLRRSPEDDKNKISVEAQKQNGQSSYNVEYERKLYENKYGSIGANVGVNKGPGQKPESQVGVSGSFHW